jgi:hypothetical protein
VDFGLIIRPEIRDITTREASMSGELRNRIHRHGELLHNTLEGAVLTSGMLIGMLAVLLILYVGSYLTAH